MSDTTVSESKRLVSLESTIESGRKTFMEVGLALAEIRDDRLYRADFKTFEEYCRGKWGWNRAHCNQLIAGASAVKSLPDGMDTMVSNQRQARELSKVEPAKRVEVITQASAQAASEDRPMTAKDITRSALGFFQPGCRPVSAPSEEAQNADNESDAIYQLKRWWHKAGKKDKTAFLKWAHKHQ